MTAMTAPRLVTPADILPMDEYGRRRAELRRELSALRARRRVSVGPFATFSFECRRTVWHQIHEMLFIEKGGEAQVEGELAAYNPLIPNGSELVATMMIEIEDAAQRALWLAKLGHIEDTVSMKFGAASVAAVPEADAERTNEQGKTSSVHFLHFTFAPAQVAMFKAPGAEVVLAVGHPEYRHMAVLPEVVRAELAGDFAV